MDAYVGEIRIFAGNYAPSGWAFCDGASMSVSQNAILFSIIGSTYGGDGKTVFNLPDLRDRAPMHIGTGVGLTSRTLGSKLGNPTVTLNETQIPSHNHIPQGSSLTAGTSTSPENAVWGAQASGLGAKKPYKTLDTANQVGMNNNVIGMSGSSQPHNNMQPFVAMNFIICIEDGEYPVKP